MKTILIYDGSFTGFLSAVYKVFEENLQDVSIVKPKHYHPDIFVNGVEVDSSEKLAKRVWTSLELKIGKYASNELYKAFLSEIKGTEDVLLRYIIYVYASESYVPSDVSNINALRVSQVARMVTRELHHIQNYLSFTENQDGLDIAALNSGFDMLPLLGNYFKKRKGNKKWLIHDKRRGYALFYNLKEVKQIKVSPERQAQILQESNNRSSLMYVNLQNKPLSNYNRGKNTTDNKQLLT
ncbi:TIGR03915 family putative DNA repair protein [Galbibacter mesophilus]|uniref:TIGR03915 family putative DNA repair protein n=1 Tax=Galbibacter mesophilus TaxID=379069 RepID=UPI00191CCEEA|nr:TIGR03915 family putative DNA repair protein [Galbibacter mesophilus]MCM5662719.1 TIGR03915 family putative DNA repair protein [Galbibacter mesophilus]